MNAVYSMAFRNACKVLSKLVYSEETNLFIKCKTNDILIELADEFLEESNCPFNAKDILLKIYEDNKTGDEEYDEKARKSCEELWS